MSIVETQENENEEQNNVVAIRAGLAIVGGGGGLGPSWLSALPEGAIFLSKPKRPAPNRPDYVYDAWRVVTQLNPAVPIARISAMDNDLVIWVNTIGFSEDQTLGDWRKDDGGVRD
jgi:hypothetical protein